MDSEGGEVIFAHSTQHDLPAVIFLSRVFAAALEENRCRFFVLIDILERGIRQILSIEFSVCGTLNKSYYQFAIRWKL